MKLMRSAAAAALFALAAGSASAAVMVTIDGSSAQGGTNAAGIDFAQGYGAHTPDGASWAGIDTVTGNSSGNWQSPFNSNGLTDIQSYFSADPQATLTFGTAQTEFSMLWGSIDSYNTITFLDGNSVIGSFTGSDVIAQFGLGGSPANFERVGLFTFATDGQAETFDAIRFGSTQAAFEFATAPAPVPLPAAGWMLAASVAGIGAMRRRRKS
jgi:hypothetical protein